MSEYKIKTINGKQIPEHRAVIEELLDIKLNKNQVVHHINGNKKDNRPENLQVMDWREHSRLHASRMAQTPEKRRKISEARKGKPNTRLPFSHCHFISQNPTHKGCRIIFFAVVHFVTDGQSASEASSSDSVSFDFAKPIG